MRDRSVWILYAITLFVFRFSGLDNLYGAVTLVENGEARARIYHAPLSQEPHARNIEDDPGAWRRGPEAFRRGLLSHDERMEKLLANAVADLVYHIERMSGAVLELLKQNIRGRFAGNDWPHDKTVYVGMGPADGGGMSESAETMLANLHEGIERNHNFGSAAAERFLHLRGGRSLVESIKYSSDPYRIVYQIPDRLKTAMDRDVVGQGLRFYGTRLNDDSYLETLTYSSTWDAQGLYGYRHGAVWYRIPFALDESLLEQDEDGSRPVGLFLGGADGVVRVWCNDEYAGSAHTSFGVPNIFDLTDHVRTDGENLVAIQIERVGNDIGTEVLLARDGQALLPVIVSPDAEDRFRREMDGNGFFRIDVPEGQDGRLWRLHRYAGQVALLTVPPYLARNADELLLPKDVVKADAGKRD